MKRIVFKALAEIVRVVAAAVLAVCGVSVSGCILPVIF